ncbi:MAG: hypothetical protein ABI426_08875 [Flavobacterium sp.]
MEKSFKPNPKSFKNTFCVFQEVELQLIEGKKADFSSDSGSLYFYTKEGMFRLSNHWGRLANSKWRLVSEIESKEKTKLGFASWNDFHPDNATENLYYLEVDYVKETVLYQHKNNPNFDDKAILRTALETTKRIKQARNILTLTNWAKYLEHSDINELRKEIITQLIYTNKSLEEIKQNRG